MTAASPHHPASARRRPRQNRSAANVDSIVAATALLLIDTPPSDLTARMIGKSANVSPATVYRYFSDVDHVVDAVLVEHAQVVTAAISQALATSRHRSVAGVFQLVVDTHLRLYASRPDLTTTWMSDELSEKRRKIEVESDRSLSRQVGQHLVDRGLISELTNTEVRLLDAHWVTAGALLGMVLAANQTDRAILIDELRRLVAHFAARYAAA